MCNEEIVKHMEEDMIFRGLSERTQKSYIWRVNIYIYFHKEKDQVNLEILREYFKVYRPKHKENYTYNRFYKRRLYSDIKKYFLKRVHKI